MAHFENLTIDVKMLPKSCSMCKMYDEPNKRCLLLQIEVQERAKRMKQCPLRLNQTKKIKPIKYD